MEDQDLKAQQGRVVEREFILAQHWHAWRSRRKRKAHDCVSQRDGIYSSSDTIVIYPDRFGNYDLAEIAFPEDHAERAAQSMEATPAREEKLKVPVAQAFLPQGTKTRRVKAEPRFAPPTERVQKVFRKAHPALAYGVVGFASFLAIFATAKRSHSTVYGEARMNEMAASMPAANSLNSAATYASTHAPRPHRGRSARVPDVIVRHYDTNYRTVARRSGVQHFSDLP